MLRSLLLVRILRLQAAGYVRPGWPFGAGPPAGGKMLLLRVQTNTVFLDRFGTTLR